MMIFILLLWCIEAWQGITEQPWDEWSDSQLRESDLLPQLGAPLIWDSNRLKNHPLTCMRNVKMSKQDR